MNKFLEFFRSDHETLVKTITLDNIELTSDSKKIQEGKIYFHLYESFKGKRRAVIKTTFVNRDEENLKQLAMKLDLYQTKIIRWLAGRRDPEIPSYSEIGEEDTANQLKGHI